MGNMSNTLEKLNGSINRLETYYLGTIEQLTKENRGYREEILKLEKSLSGIIEILAGRVLK